MKILINGFCGKMGQQLFDICEKFDDTQVVCGVDTKEKIEQFCPKNSSVKLKLLSSDDLLDAKNTSEMPEFFGKEILSYDSKNCFLPKKFCDVAIDFSHSKALNGILQFCLKTGTPLVIATTGHTDEQEESIVRASVTIPIFKSRNLSFGVWHFLNLVGQATKSLKDFDIEIVETHHSTKVDSPSGTARAMFDEVKKIRKNAKMVQGRSAESLKRNKFDVGVHSVRGGGVCGEHCILFLSQNEEISICHRANNKEEFARGAIFAGKFLCTKKCGLFEMKDLFEEKI
jgi:4-hydroxy-tetrahydrodipicolinate reductase